MLERMETVMHSEFGGSEYWAVSRHSFGNNLHSHVVRPLYHIEGNFCVVQILRFRGQRSNMKIKTPMQLVFYMQSYWWFPGIEPRILEPPKFLLRPLKPNSENFPLFGTCTIKIVLERFTF